MRGKFLSNIKLLHAQSSNRSSNFMKQEKQLLDRASELKQQKLDILGAQKKGFALATSEIQGLVEFVERSVENSTDHAEEFMSLQQEQIQEQCVKHEHINLIQQRWRMLVLEWPVLRVSLTSVKRMLT